MRSSLLSCMLLLACAPELGDDGVVSDTGPADPDDVEHIDHGDGITSTVIDATDHEQWVYLDLETARIVEVDDPAIDTGWDIALQRFQPKVNGGISGNGDVAVAMLDGQDFAALSQAPADGYDTDQPDADDDGVPEYVMGDWYDYDAETHILTPADRVYVVRTVEGAHHKLAFESYYDDAGTPGFVQFRWGPVPSP